MCAMVAALVGGTLALVGVPTTPALPPDAADEAPAAPEGKLIRTRVDAMAVAAGPAAATGDAILRARAEDSLGGLPQELRLCWSPTARRLLGSNAKQRLEQLGTRVRVLTESDRGALGRLARGDDDLALIAGCVTDEERRHGFTSRVLGYHVLVAIVHENNPLHGLPRHLLRAALIGEASAWQHVGAGSAAPITVVGVAEDPFTDQATSLVLLGDRLARGSSRLATDDDVRAFVAEHENALGLCSLAAVRRAPRGVRVLLVDTIAPSAAAYAAGQYPYASPIRLVSRDMRACAWFDDGFGSDALSPLR